MEQTSEFAIIGMQRTGTTVLTHMLNTHREIYTAREIFHPDDTGIDSFANFLSESASPLLTLSARQSAYGDFINNLRSATGKRVIGVNIKYSSCHQLNGDWKGLSKPPEIFDIFRRRGTRIIHIVRENIFDTAISIALASATDTWHCPRGTLSRKGPVELDASLIVSLIELCESERSAFNRFAADFPWILTISYEEMFEGGMFRNSIVHRLAHFLEIDENFERRPLLEKIMPDDISEAIANFDGIKDAANGAGYGRFL